MESKRHSRDMEKDLSRDVHRAEWTMKEQKLQDDIKTLREQLLLLVSLRSASARLRSLPHHFLSPPVLQDRQRSSPDHRRYSMLEPSALDSEVSRLRQRLLSTEDALRNALEHNQQVDQLVQAMRRHPEKSPVRLGDGWTESRPVTELVLIDAKLTC